MAVSTVSGTCPGKCKLLPEVEHFSLGFHLGCITISLPNLFLYKLSGLETAILYIDNSLPLIRNVPCTRYGIWKISFVSEKH